MTAREVTDEQLAAYVLGEADARTAHDIEARLDESVDLRAAIAGMRDLVDTLDADASAEPPPDLMRRVLTLLRGRRAQPNLAERLAGAMQVVAELIFDSGRPAAAGLRGGATAHQLTYRTDLGTVDLRLSPHDARTRRSWRVRGQLDASSRGVTTVALVRAGTGEEVTQTEADERGHFCLAADPGIYDVLIAPDDTRILVLRDVEVGDS